MKTIILILMIWTLYINKDILKSFTYCDNEFSDKVWHTAMISPEQGWFQSIWLTDIEYRTLKHKGNVKTIYSGKPIKIKVE